MKKLRLLFIISFLIFNKILAQNGDYIITKDFDTLYGQINGVRAVHLKLKTGKEKKKYSSNEIFGYYSKSKNKFYQSIKSPLFSQKGESIFILRIVSGKINLYSRLINTQYGITEFYIIKNNSAVFRVFTNHAFSNKKRHRKTRKLIEDNPELTKEFDLLKGTMKNIKYILNKYNDN